MKNRSKRPVHTYKPLLILILMMLLVSCSSTRLEETAEQQPSPVTADSWLVPSVNEATKEQWEDLLRQLEEREKAKKAAAEPEEESPLWIVVEESVEEISEEPEHVESVIEESLPDEEILEITKAPFEILDEPDTNVDILPAETEPTFLPAQVAMLAGEDVPVWESMIPDPEPAADLGNPVTLPVEKTDPEPVEVEDVNPDIISAMAAEYRDLEVTERVVPTFMDRLFSFLKKNILYLEIAGLIIVAILVVLIISRKASRKALQSSLEEEEEDKGEEIDMTPGRSSYYGTAKAEESPEEENTDEQNAPPPPDNEGWDDGY